MSIGRTGFLKVAEPPAADTPEPVARPEDVCKYCSRPRADHTLASEQWGNAQAGWLACPDGRSYVDPAASFGPPGPAPLPTHHPSLGGHAGYLALLDEMRTLHLKKATDYGRGADPLANCRASEEFGVPAWQGVMIRANDKIHRVKSYCQNGTLANEGVRDSLMDLAAYALIALALFDEEQAKKGGGK